MSDKKIKTNLELYCPGDGRTFLTYWSEKHNDNIITELKGGKIFIIDREIPFRSLLIW